MKRMLGLCLLVMVGAVHAMGTDSGSFKSVYADHDVTLQTDPGSAFWQKAVPVYADLDTHGNVVPAHRTEVRSRWTKKNLYLLYICPYEDLYLKPNPETATETYQLWNWDVAEIFISSDFQHIRKYKEFEVSPQAEWTDLDIDLALPDHTVGWTWNSGFEVSAHVDPKTKTWYGAMRIPFSAIDSRAPIAGNKFRANLLRSQGPPERRKSITWKSPMSSTFHVPEKFGQLELVTGN